MSTTGNTEVHGRPIGHWSEIAHLWERATGGRDIAADPATWKPAWPSAPPAPGVEESLQWLLQGLTGQDQRMVFLVGGPGAGKSHAAGGLIAGLSLVDPPTDGLSARRYLYETGGDRQLLIINDATMPDDAKLPGALARDVNDALQHGWHLMACINRGVIVEELPHLTMAGDESVRDIIRWLHGDEDSPLLRAVEPASAHLDDDTSYLRLSTLERAGLPEVDLACVFMDVCSLLEVRPTVAIPQGSLGFLAPTIEGYEVTSLAARRSLDDLRVPAARLFGDAIDRFDVSTAAACSPLDPIAANVESLSSPAVRSGVLSVLRTAEVVAGQRLTFRELWGCLVRCLVGDLTERENGDAVQAWLTDHGAGDAGEPVAPHDRMVRIQTLASLRFSEALFGVGASSWRDNPVTFMTRPVDPATDAIPGFILEEGPGWATPVLDAFILSEHFESPLDALVAALPETDPFTSGVTRFDREVDTAVVEALNEMGLLDERQRRDILAWYGAYLQRLYAVCNGIGAFRAEVESWTESWRLSPVLPDDLRSDLEALLLPRRDPVDPSSSVLLPVLDGRVKPLQGSQPDPRLAVRVGQVSLRTKRRGDSQTLLLEGPADLCTAIQLDFGLIREASSCSSGRVGVTEVVHAVAPRLERFWASRLARARRLSPDLVLLDQEREKGVKLP